MIDNPGLSLLFNGNNQWDAPDETSGPVYFGAADWEPVVGDWNGDGTDEVGAYRDGVWWRDILGACRMSHNLEVVSDGEHLGGKNRGSPGSDDCIRPW